MTSLSEITREASESAVLYDYSKSTEDNWGKSLVGDEIPVFVGKYIKERRSLDYTYHKYYTPERQLLQDELMQNFFETKVHDTISNVTCDRPLENWIVFTAGPMGAGKGRTMHWLATQGLFPLSAFVRVDMDSLRHLLPELPGYINRNPATAGYMTQKEVGYVAEILTIVALNEGKNVLVDGTLRDAVWYSMYIDSLHVNFPRMKFAIIHVTAKEHTVLQRAEKRAEITGRVVPKEVILDAMFQIPHSIKVLAPQVNFMATFDNEGEEPVLLWSSSKLSHPSLLCAESISTKVGKFDVDGHQIEYSVDETGRLLHGESLDWADNFKETWKMQCALP